MIKEKNLKILFVAIAFLAYLRIYFGINHNDEIQYIGSDLIRYLGGRPFQEEPFIQQVANLFVAPFAELLVWIESSLEGVMLKLRHLYFAVSLATAITSYVVLSRLFPHRKEAAWIASLTFLAPCTGHIPSLAYPSMGTFFVSMSMLFFLYSRIKKPFLWSTVSGVCLGISLCSYISLSVYSLVFATVFLLGAYFHPDLRKNFSARASGVLIGSFGVTVSMMIYVLSFGWENIQEGFQYSLRYDIGVSLATKWQFIVMHFQYYKEGWEWAAPLFLVGLALRKKIPLEITMLAVLLLLAVLNWRFTAPSFSVFALIYIAFLYFYHVVRLRKESGEGLEVFLLTLALLIMAPLAAMISSASFHTTPVVLTLATALAIFALAARQSWVGQWTAVVLQLFLAFNYLGCYSNDFPFVKSIVRVESGPAAGLFTFGARKEFYESVERDLRSAEQHGKTLFSPSYPMGYLQSRLKIHSRAVYGHGFFHHNLFPFYDAYFAKNGPPDIYFELMRSPNFEGSIDDFVQSGRFNDHLGLRQVLTKYGKYRQITKTDNYTIWARF